MTILVIVVILIAAPVTLVASALAYAIRSMSKVTLEEELAKRGRAIDAPNIIDRRIDLALTASIVRIVCNVSIVAVLMADVLMRHAEPANMLWLAVAAALAFFIQLIFSVALATAWANYAGESLIASTWPTLQLVDRGLYPLVRFLRLFDSLLRRLIGITPESQAMHETHEQQEEILAVVSEGTAGGAVDDEQRKMIEGIISFRDLQVSQIMTPRTDMVSINVSDPLDVIRDKIMKDGLSRVPVHEGSTDNIVGLLYAKDLLPWLGSSSPADPPDVAKLMRPPLFVPHSKPLRDLLRQFRSLHVHMAIVLDEFGGTAGLVTSEDILEEIVGDIADEYEKLTPLPFRRIDDRTVEVDGRANVTDINRELDLKLPENQDYQTIGGLMISELGIIPAKGTSLEIVGIELTVTESDQRRIRKVRICTPQQMPQEGSQTGTQLV